MARKKKTVTPEEINNETVEIVKTGSPETSTPTGEEITEAVKDEPAPEVTEEPVCAAEEKAEAAVEESTPEVETVAEDAQGGAPETSTPTGEMIEAEEAEVAEDAEGGSPETSTTTDDMIEAEETETEDEGGEAVTEEAEVSEDAADEATEVAEQTAEVVDEAEPEEESEAPAEFMNIEHFADYRSKDEPITGGEDEVTEITEDTEDGEPTPDDGESTEDTEGDGINEEEFHEYENLTILDELEDEESAPLPPAVRKVSKDEEAYDEKKPRRVDARFDIIEMFVCMLVAIMLLSAFVFRHSVVDGGSMENTLYDDEHLIISNFFYEPKQYDIIVCEDYSTGLKKPIIKRVIATEGQTVRVVSMDEVYVDGVLVDTSFILIDGKEELIYASKYPIECVVPEGEVFVMGDHRNNSLDSRILGTIDEDTILGKVVLRFYPFDRFGKVE